MEPSVEQLDLIKSCIVQSAYYDQKKHKIGDIANLVFEKAHLFLNSVSNEKTLKKYIIKVTNEVLEKYSVETNIQDIVHQQDVFVDEISLNELETVPLIEEAQFDETKEAIETTLKAEKAPVPPVVELEIPDIQNIENSITLEELSMDGITGASIDEDLVSKERVVQATVTAMLNEIPDIGIPDIPDVAPDVSIEDLIPKESQEALYIDLEDPIVGIKSKKISKELTEKIIDIVLAAQKEDSGRQYAKIFYSKYVKKMKQSEIARELGISEEELSNRYLRLVRIVKRQIG